MKRQNKNEKRQNDQALSSSWYLIAVLDTESPFLLPQDWTRSDGALSTNRKVSESREYVFSLLS